MKTITTTGTVPWYEDNKRLIEQATRKWLPEMTSSRPNEMDPMQLLYGRLRIRMGEQIPAKHVSLYVSGEQAVVFLVANDGKVAVLEDDPALFPSDKLITEIRLLTGA